jgi:DNA-binding NarL/FixJ family response regulator
MLSGLRKDSMIRNADPADAELISDQPRTTVNVLLVEDHEMVAQALATTLATDPNLKVVGVTGHGAKALAVLRSNQVDVVLLDLRLSEGEDAIPLIPNMLAIAPEVKILVLSAQSDDYSLTRAVQAGCHGYLLKDQAVSELVRAIHSLKRGDAVFAPAVLGRVLKLLRPGLGRPETLSIREVEILQLLTNGKAITNIAAELFLSTNTIRNHVQSITRKLHAHSRSEAVAAGLRTGLVHVC